MGVLNTIIGPTAAYRVRYHDWMKVIKSLTIYSNGCINTHFVMSSCLITASGLFCYQLYLVLTYFILTEIMFCCSSGNILRRLLQLIFLCSSYCTHCLQLQSITERNELMLNRCWYQSSHVGDFSSTLTNFGSCLAGLSIGFGAAIQILLHRLTIRH